MNYLDPKKYDNCYLNESGYIIGGGHSIRELVKSGFDFKKLNNSITIGVNKAYDLLVPTYVIIGDPWFWKNFCHEIRQIDCLKIIPDNVIKSCRITDKDVYGIKRYLGSWKTTSIISQSFTEEISFWNTTGTAALRVAYIMGLNPVYLIGIDCAVSNEKGQTHFHNGYVGSNRNSSIKPNQITEKWKKQMRSRYGNFYRSFAETIKYMKIRRKGFIVYSCSPISKLNDIIPYKNLHTLFR